MLLEERVNAKLLQYKLKRLGISVSLWEIFSLFEFVNMRHAKMAYEPQRYHYVMFEHLYKAMTSSDYKTDMLGDLYPDQATDKKGKKDKKAKKQDDAEDDDAMSIAKDLNEGQDADAPVKPEESSKKSSSSSSSSSSDKSSSSDSDSDASLC